YTDSSGGRAFIDIDTREWSLSKRTVSSVLESDNIFYWEDVGSIYQDGYDDGYETARDYYGWNDGDDWYTADEVWIMSYEHAREEFGYYDPITERWLSVEEYLDLYGNMDQTNFYNNFDKYFIPAMIIVFGGAIVLTILKVF